MLSVVMIVRAEERMLPGALASLGTPPDLVVCDTGSRDRTVDVAQGAGARIFAFPWPGDFARARTEAQRHGRFDWVMRFDADERLVVRQGTPGAWLAGAIERAERAEADLIYVPRRYSPTNLHWFPRIYRRSRFRWVHPVHELLTPMGERRRVVAAGGAVVVHGNTWRPRGYGDLVASHLVGSPSPHLRYYLARSLFDEGRAPEARAAVDAYLSGPADYPFHVGEAWRMRGLLARAAGQDATSEACLQHAAWCNGRRAEPWLDLARIALARGDRHLARRWIRMGAETPPPLERGPFGAFIPPYLLDLRAYRADTWRRLWREAA